MEIRRLVDFGLNREFGRGNQREILLHSRVQNRREAAGEAFGLRLGCLPRHGSNIALFRPILMKMTDRSLRFPTSTHRCLS